MLNHFYTGAENKLNTDCMVFHSPLDVTTSNTLSVTVETSMNGTLCCALPIKPLSGDFVTCVMVTKSQAAIAAVAVLDLLANLNPGKVKIQTNQRATFS